MHRYIGKPDPNGYYVLVFRREVLDRFSKNNEYFIEEYGDLVIVRVKSRSEALKLLKKYREYLVVR